MGQLYGSILPKLFLDFIYSNIIIIIITNGVDNSRTQKFYRHKTLGIDFSYFFDRKRDSVISLLFLGTLLPLKQDVKKPGIRN